MEREYRFTMNIHHSYTCLHISNGENFVNLSHYENLRINLELNRKMIRTISDEQWENIVWKVENSYEKK